VVGCDRFRAARLRSARRRSSSSTGISLVPEGHLDRFDEGQHAPVEGRATDAERVGRLRAGIGEPLDARRLADDHERRRGHGRRRVSLHILGATAKTSARHERSVHKS
jgi:hypothetical protein